MDVPNLNRFPRKILTHPVQIEHLKNLSEDINGPDIYMLPDHLNQYGGNKTRKLEWLIGDALDKGATDIITQGAIQSNHARQTAAVSANQGMKCHILLEDRIGDGTEEYYRNGNVLLCQLFGASVESYPGKTDMNKAMEYKASKLKAEGKKPYIIPGGGSNAVGALGYVNAARDIVNQAKEKGLVIDHIVHATGSTGTQAGLVAGLHALKSDIPLLGISVKAPERTQVANVLKLAKEVTEKLEVETPLPDEAVQVDDRFVGEGYGIPAEDTIAAIELFARKEGVLLDPVYSGKGAAGLLHLIREGRFKKGEKVLFIHTGGAQALSGYRDAFDVPEIPRYSSPV